MNTSGMMRRRGQRMHPITPHTRVAGNGGGRYRVLLLWPQHKSIKPQAATCVQAGTASMALHHTSHNTLQAGSARHVPPDQQGRTCR